jgi:hypothetical protein
LLIIGVVPWEEDERDSDQAKMNLRLLGPASFAQGHLLTGLFAASVDLALPGKVLAKTGLSVTGVVEVNLGDLCLDKRPNTPSDRY